LFIAISMVVAMSSPLRSTVVKAQSETAKTTGVGGGTRKTLDFDGDDRADYAVISSGGVIPPETLSPKSPKQRIKAGIPRPMPTETNGGGGPVNWDILRNSGAGSTSVTFGQLGDFFVPGQFTSDNRTDIAIWDSSTQQFTICNSNVSDIFTDPTPCGPGETITTVAIGDVNSDPTVIGDYTGDGIDDPCVFTGTQWVYLPNNGDGTFGAAVTVSFGQLGDFPSPGDYNGDGLDDFGVARTAPGNPSLGFFSIDFNGVTPGVPDREGAFGESDDVVVPADYDGDGETEVAIADVTNFTFIRWIYFSSAAGIVVGHDWGDNSIGFQVQADYDGDDVDDVAVWHTDPSGTFFVRRSSDLAMGVVSWGASTDYPVAYYQSH
jgi:hypothetical protein